MTSESLDEWMGPWTIAARDLRAAPRRRVITVALSARSASATAPAPRIVPVLGPVLAAWSGVVAGIVCRPEAASLVSGERRSTYVAGPAAAAAASRVSGERRSVFAMLAAGAIAAARTATARLPRILLLRWVIAAPLVRSRRLRLDDDETAAGW